MAGCAGCGGSAVKGSFSSVTDTLDTSIRRAAAKVLSGRASYVHMKMRDADVTISPVEDARGKGALVIVTYPDKPCYGETIRES